MAAKYARIKCPICERPIAGAPTRTIGMLSVMDHKDHPRSLVLCEGSMRHVKAPDARFVQEALEALEQIQRVRPGTLF